MAKPRRKLWKVLRVIGLVLVLLLVVPLALVHAALLLPPVRNFVRDKATAAASDALKAKVQIDRLNALSIFRVRATGVRVLSLKDEKLASLQSLAVDLDPFALLFKRISVVNVELDRPYVDMGAPMEEGGGLLGLFKSDEPEPEKKPDSGPPAFEFALGNLRIAHGRVDVKAQGAQYRIEPLDTELGARVGEAIAGHVKRIDAAITRNGEGVGRIEGRDLAYGGDGAARARLDVQSGETALRANAQLGARAPDGGQPVNATLHLGQLSPDTLANLGLPADTLTSPVSLDAKASGTTKDLTYSATLTTDGGKVLINGQLQGTELSATVRTDQLEPRRFLSANIDPVSALLQVRASQDPETQHAKLDVELVRGSYAGGVLPHLDVHARRNERGDLYLDGLRARYPQGKGELSATGRQSAEGALAVDAKIEAPSLAELPPVQQLGLPFAGALRGDVRLKRAAGGAFKAEADLQLTQARLDTLRAEALTVKIEAHGDALDRPALVVEAHAGELHLARTHLERADLTIAGGPERYFIAGRFGDRGALRAELLRSGAAVSANARFTLAIDKNGVRRPLRLEIGEFSYVPDGAIAAKGVRLSYRDACAVVDGSLDEKRHSALRARIDIPKLEELTELVMEKPITGSLVLDADASGATATPKVSAHVRYRVKALQGLKNLAVDLDADADVTQRRAALTMEARSSAGRVSASATTELRNTRATAASFIDGLHDVSVRFDRFKVSELAAWPHHTMVPILAVLSGEVTAKGRVKTPELSADLKSTMKFGSDAGSLSMSLRGGYAREHINLNVEAQDRRGPLLRTKIDTDLTRQRISRDPDFVKRVLRERSWEASVWLGGRRLDELPLVRALKVPEAALPAQVSAQLDLKHMPGKEPEGRLQMRAAWDPPGADADQSAKRIPISLDKSNPKRCGMDNRPAFNLDVRMHEGELHSELVASLENKPAVTLRTESHAPIDEWLQPKDPVQIRPAGVALQFTDVQLARMPLVCELVTGRIDGKAEMSRALTAQVSASVNLHGSQIRFTKAPPFEAHITGTANKQALDLTTKLGAAQGSAVIATKIPLEGRGRMPSVNLDAPFYGRVQIHNMDVRALLGPVPNVRASSGTLDSDLTVTGSILNPDLQGRIGVRDVTVTLAELGQRVERVSGDLKLDHRTIYLERLKVHDRDGVAELSGQFTLRGLGSYAGQVEVKADDFPVRKTGVMLARFDGKAGLKADIKPDRTQFDLVMRGARIELTDEDMGSVQSLRTHPDIVFSDEGVHEVKRVEEAAATPLVFNIDASEPFWVTRSDFSVLVSTKIKVEAIEGPVSVTGAVNIDRGYVELIGQSFDIEKGHIEFSGGREVEPSLDLTANHRSPGGAKVTIKATGTLAEPQLAFFVDDEAVTAGEALAAASGSRGSGSDSTVQQQVSSMATGLAAGVLTLGARRELGEWMPVLSIDAGENGPSFRAGIQADRFIPKFLRKVVVDAYVEGMLSSGSDEPGNTRGQQSSSASPAALLELRFPHDLVGEAQYGPGQRFSVDFGWEP